MLRVLLIGAAVALVLGVLYLALEATAPTTGGLLGAVRPGAGVVGRAPASAWQRLAAALGIGAAAYGGGARGAQGATQLADSVGWMQG